MEKLNSYSKTYISKYKKYDISGALFTLRTQFEYTQCKEGARYVIFVLFVNITLVR